MDPGRRSTAALLFGVYATLALDTYSTLNSSPQTTELFAQDREDSLMHWVLIGDVVAMLGGLWGAWLDKSAWPLMGAAVIVLMMHALYRHAVARGKNVPPPANSA